MSEPHDVTAARKWYEDYDGPKGKGCDPETGEFFAKVGFNTPSGQGARGVSITIYSHNEASTLLWLHKSYKGTLDG